jgi:hypothetical protein
VGIHHRLREKRKNWVLVAFTINGVEIWHRALQAEVTQWTAWASRARFDFLAFSDVAGRLFVWEAYAPAGSWVREFDAWVVGVHYLECQEAVVVVLDSGKIEFVQLGDRIE